MVQNMVSKECGKRENYGKGGENSKRSSDEKGDADIYMSKTLFPIKFKVSNDINSILHIKG